MKKYLFAVVCLFMISGAKAAMDVNEVATYAAVTTFSVSNTAVDMSSSTIISNPVAYNITNNDASVTLYCGYSTLVATSGNYQGFKVLPGATQYRAVRWPTKLYCIAATAAISVTRELFGIK